MTNETSGVVDSIVAKIEAGALGAGYSATEKRVTETVTNVYVKRYGRQDRGFIRVDDGAVDLTGLDIAGMGKDRVMAALVG